MKLNREQILPPLASAFLIPGLGQILNGQPKKALVLMGLVFVQILLFVIIFISALKSDKEMIESLSRGGLEPFSFLLKNSYLSFFICTLSVTWLYGVIDAFYCARRKFERGRK